MQGYIESIETMGLVDGPGIRFVVFMQGCPLRCLYCHNPETWSFEQKNTITPEDLVKQILKYKNYFDDGGGVTFSGGEPLAQPEFLLECLKLCKKNNIHTCLDTSGVGTKLLDEILDYTDLIILDIKAVDSKEYEYITSKDNSIYLKFLDLCQTKNKKMWLRQVIVPGINDDMEHINKFKKFIKPLKNIENVELLPYHLYGVEKYKKLGIKYRLDGVKPMDVDKCKKLQEELLKK